MTSKITTLICVGLLTIAAGCNADSASPSDSATAAAASCAGCHRGGMSFSGKDASALADTIKAIRDGQKKHPPLALADDSDEAIAALADALVAE